jgi:hypothetical protein
MTVPDHNARIDKLLAEAVGRDLSSWERNEFLPSLRNFWTLSAKQEKILADLERRVYDGEDDCA